MSRDPEIILGKSGYLKRAFSQSDPRELKAIQSNPGKLAQMRALDDWARKVRADFAREVRDKRSEWVSQEAGRIWDERTNNTQDLRPPHMQDAILPEARRRVASQIESRYRQIEEQRRARCAQITGRPLEEITPDPKWAGPRM